MSLESFAASGASWLWEQYGKTIVEKAFGEFKSKWGEFKWKEAETKYLARVRDLYSTTRLLGNPKPIIIDEIFTDVYVLDKPSAFRRYDIAALQSRSLDDEVLWLEDKRKPALRLVTSEKRIYILGKPGAGKTTLLKYLALRACEGKINKTPIFLSLKEWADSGLDLPSFIEKQFTICAFPDASIFIKHILDKGDALVLFDGLDEVNQEVDQRVQTITALTDFAKQYSTTQILITCRIAATEYSFEQFHYLEIADFDNRQIHLFVKKWYQDEPSKSENFIAEFEKPENKGLRELAKTPLLLALICLAFDETLYFPNRRADLYKEALDALLKKWDSSRGIRRDDLYRKLSIGRKEQLLARLAAENFEAGTYFIQKDNLSNQIYRYLTQLPLSDLLAEDNQDGETVLKSIESQHGILVERAYNIYSFSHLTFQEYFTARYIVDNAANGTIDRLISSHLMDNRWREVFLLVFSLVDTADAFFDTFIHAINNLIRENQSIRNLLTSVKDIANRIANEQHAGVRAILLSTILVQDFLEDRTPEQKEISDTFDSACIDALFIGVELAPRLINNHLQKSRKRQGKDIIRDFRRGLLTHFEVTTIIAEAIGVYPVPNEEKLTSIDSKVIHNYIRANYLLVECLQLAVVSNRSQIEKRLFLPL